MDGISLKATAHVRITKIDERGDAEVDEYTVELTEEEAEAIWHSQQQE